MQVETHTIGFFDLDQKKNKYTFSFSLCFKQNDYQFVVNMQLAMYQMLTNVASNSTPTQPIPSLRLRSLTDHQSPIINNPKPLKRLGPQKRPRLVKTNPTGE